MDGSDAPQETDVPESGTQVDALLNVGESLCAYTDHSGVVAGALDACLATVDADAGSILLYSPDDHTLVFDYVVGPVAERLTDRRFPADRGVSGRVFQTGQSSVSDDADQEEDHHMQFACETGYRPVQMVTVPLSMPGGERLGVLQALNRRTGRFTDEDIALLMVVATQVAIVIQHTRRHEAARLATATRLLAKVGHDIKNLMAPVVAGTGALRALLDRHFRDLDAQGASRGEVTSEVGGGIERSQTQCLAALAILERASARIQARTTDMASCLKGEKRQLRLAPTDVATVVREVAQVLGPCAVAREVTLAVDAPAACQEILADASRVFDAVYNLGVNAVQHTPRGGEVTLRARCDTHPSFPGGEHVSIEVIDTGEGISAEALDRLFTSDTRSTTADGWGLGTQIVRDVADLHCGTISATSEPGRGSCFSLVLPKDLRGRDADGS